MLHVCLLYKYYSNDYCASDNRKAPKVYLNAYVGVGQFYENI